MWGARVVRPGGVIDTDRYHVICANVIGSCMGSSGPASDDPGSGQPYALRFPVVPIGDMVRAQAMLLDRLGIARLPAVVGGSMGGLPALPWAAPDPDPVDRTLTTAPAP